MASDTKQNTTFFKCIPTFPHKFSNWQATIQYYLGSDFQCIFKTKEGCELCQIFLLFIPIYHSGLLFSYFRLFSNLLYLQGM